MRAIACIALVLLVPACNQHGGRAPQFGPTLRDAARRAKEKGAKVAAIPYAIDEEEGEMLVQQDIDEALKTYEWVAGEPIEETTFGFPRVTNATEPDAIYTAYRIRVMRRFGRTQHPDAPNSLEDFALRKLPPRTNEVIVIKSGGDLTIDGVLLKKRRSLCFSELMPRPYLLALRMENSRRAGWLAMGCRSILALDEDLLTPRDESPQRIIPGLKERYGNSLATLVKRAGQL